VARSAAGKPVDGILRAHSECDGLVVGRREATSRHAPRPDVHVWPAFGPVRQPSTTMLSSLLSAMHEQSSSGLPTPPRMVVVTVAGHTRSRRRHPYGLHKYWSLQFVVGHARTFVLGTTDLPRIMVVTVAGHTRSRRRHADSLYGLRPSQLPAIHEAFVPGLAKALAVPLTPSRRCGLLRTADRQHDRLPKPHREDLMATALKELRSTLTQFPQMRCSHPTYPRVSNAAATPEHGHIADQLLGFRVRTAAAVDNPSRLADTYLGLR